MVISIADEIAVPPGQPLPKSRKKTPHGTQRVAVVPFDIAVDDWQVEDFIQWMR